MEVGGSSIWNQTNRLQVDKKKYKSNDSLEKHQEKLMTKGFA